MEIKRVFYEVNMNECFDNMTVGNIKNLSESLRNNFEHEWCNKVQDKVKLRSCREYKMSFGSENYLKLNLDRSERSFTAQLKGNFFSPGRKTLK